MPGFDFTATTRTDGTTITAAIWNPIEDGIEAASVASNLAVYGVPSVDGGTSNDAGALQAAIDALPAGGGTITLEPRTYFLDSGIFIDTTMSGFGAHTRVVINGNGATFKLGSNLPTSDWSRDTATKFAFFPNTNRAALSGGSVTVSDANRSTGSGGALRTLTIRDVTVDCQAANRGLVYANRTATTLENVTLYRGRVALTWWDYTDANAIINCYSRGGSGPAEQVIVEQHQQGDGLVVIGGKADSSVGFLRLKTCRGAHLSGLVTASVELDQCTGVVITGAHQEGQQSGRAMLEMANSECIVENSVIYSLFGGATDSAPILIDDSADTETDSRLVLRDVTGVHYYSSTEGLGLQSPLVDIVSEGNGTVVEAHNVRGRFASVALAGKWVATAMPLVDGSAAILSAFESHAGRANLATGSWRLRRLASGTWTVETPTTGITAVSRAHSAGPSIIQALTSSGVNSGGALVNGTVYAYAIAVRDALGNYSTASTETTATANANGAVLLQVGLNNAPATLVVWRKTATGVLTAPDRYAVIPINAARTYLYDTGTHIGGTPWVTTSVPVPNTVAASNATADAIVVGATTIT